MQHKHKLAIALGLLAVIGAVEVAQARIVVFGGTRSSVQRACTGPFREFSSGVDGYGVGWSRCVDVAGITSVICDDRGACVGSTFFAGGTRPKPTPPRKPHRNFDPPESLSESSSGEPSGEIGVDIPAPEPYVDIIN